MGSYANAKYLCLPLVRLKAVGVEQHSCEVSRGFTDQTKACWSQLQVMLCLAQGPCHVLCVGYSEIFLLGNPGVLGAANFPALRQELDLLPAVIALSASGKSLLGHCQGRDVAVPPRQCLQRLRNGYLHPEWEQAEAWHVSASPAPPQELQSQGDGMSGSAVVQAAGAFLSELHRDTGMLGLGYFHLWHVLTLIQLAST